MNSARLVDVAPPLHDRIGDLTSFLTRPATSSAVPAGLASLTFGEIIAAVETAGVNRQDDAVIMLYQSWIALQPGSSLLFAAWFNLGCELSRCGLTQDAIAAYRQSLARRPNFTPAAINLGLQLEKAGLPDEALQSWTEALQPDEERVALINQRARLLEQTRQLGAAEAELQRSLRINPQQPDAIQHWVHIRQKMCRWPTLSAEVPGLTPANLLAQAGPLSAMALTDDIGKQCASGDSWISRKTTPAPHHLAPVDGYSHRRIRIGYLSSDFCSHAMSYLIAELIETHDRGAFEVFGYCSSPQDGSAIRSRITSAFDHLRLIRDLPDEKAARIIRADEIDILVDLNGLTTGTRIQVLRWKPAPVQATYLGFVGPVPLPELDYLFCDDGVIPPELAAQYAPRPLRIGRVYQANDSKRAVGSRSSRAAAGLPENCFVFCCFSNTYKITEEMFNAWMVVLRRTPNSVLWLMHDNEWASASMCARATAAGVDAKRIILTPRVEPAEYMARLPLGDLFLDTFPYNAGTVASDAIRMGLPLLTLSGTSFASRMAKQLLAGVDVADGVATDLKDYIDTAVALAGNPIRYRAYRAQLGAGGWATSLGDTLTFTHEYEAALGAIRITPRQDRTA